MLKNYLTIAFRNLARHKGFTTINIAGLALGLACCLLILLFIQDERSYDRFHEHADAIYRVAVERSFPNRVVQSAATPRPLAAALAQDIPDVLHATRLSNERAERVLVRRGDQRFFENGVLFADANVFDVFTLPLLQGSPATALAEPFSIVLTESTARTYFGDSDPMGQTLTLRLSGDRTSFDYRVTGITRDVPDASHFHFDLLASYAQHPNVGDAEDQDNWLGMDLYTYVRLRDGADVEALEAAFPALLQTYVNPRIETAFGTSTQAFADAGNRYAYFTQPLTALHLHSKLRGEIEPNSDVLYVYVFGVIALFILLIACINFTNLATARCVRRAREVGVRKALGAPRSQLVRQFLAESMLLTVVAFLLALACVELVLPTFNAFTGKHLATYYLAGGSLVWLAAFALGAGLLAGLYPAFYLSAFRPATALKSPRTGTPRSLLRNGLVVFQFAVSTALIVGTLVVSSQLDYALTKKLGFDKEQVIVLEGTETLGTQIEAFTQAVRAQPSVVSTANGQTVPGRPFGRTFVRLEDTPQDDPLPVAWMTVGFDYPETLGLAVIQGRSFSRDFPTDSMAVLLNETAVRELDLTEPVGKTLIENDRVYTIAGVVQDFHFTSLHQPIGAFVLFGPDPFNQNRPNQIVATRVRTDASLREGRLPGTLAALEATWRTFAPEQPFAYSFLDADVEALYRADRKTGDLLSLFALLAIVIACLGLFGLAAFTAEQRTKEIGVRKVLGASVTGLVVLLSKDFTRLVTLGFLIAAPLTYLAMNRWLDAFAYRVEMSGWTFLIAGLTALGVAILTVSYQAIRAALADPVKSLRYE